MIQREKIEELLKLPVEERRRVLRLLQESLDDELVMAVLLDSGFLFASLNASESHEATSAAFEILP